MNLTNTTPVKWDILSEYTDGTGDTFYKLYVSTSFMDGHLCVFKDNLLTINRVHLSAEEPSLKFKVSSIEEAGELVLKFAEGMNCLEDFTKSIYYKK